jgi:hypothetical protein
MAKRVVRRRKEGRQTDRPHERQCCQAHPEVPGAGCVASEGAHVFLERFSKKGWLVNFLIIDI